VTVAEIKTGKDSYICISLYGLFEKVGNTNYSITNLHRILSDLTGILNSRSKKIILGGDFNASLQFDKLQTGESHRIFFERLEDFGLINCYKPFHQNFIQTLRDPRSTTPWQDDYLFISNALTDKLISCEVLENDKIKTFSDHNPVMISLNL